MLAKYCSQIIFHLTSPLEDMCVIRTSSLSDESRQPRARGVLVGERGGSWSDMAVVEKRGRKGLAEEEELVVRAREEYNPSRVPVGSRQRLSAVRILSCWFCFGASQCSRNLTEHLQTHRQEGAEDS